MIPLLFRYQACADAAMLHAIRNHEPAARDGELLKKLHHILVAHRFWTHLAMGLPFHAEAERKAPETLGEVAARFRETQEMEDPWLEALQESQLSRVVETPYFQGRQIPVRDALLQVCLHSQGHRAQCAARLRELGGTPPVSDFIFWVEDQPLPEWQ